MKKSSVLCLSLITSSITFGCQADKTRNEVEPNIVFIYLDDLGIGDVSAYQMGKIKTPNFDKIAKEGILFNNAYSTSATCTPSRYSLLTGDYPWRNKDANVLPGDAPMLIQPKKETLPKMLNRAGYETAVIGKWHLGLGDGNVNWNEHIQLNPNTVGFDYSYIMAATNDRVPNVFVENGNVVGLDPNDPLEVSYKKNFEGEPTGKANPEMLKMMYSHGHNMSINNGISRIGYQKGGKSAQWVDENMAENFLNKAKEFVKKDRKKPFFLYYALHQPHVPRVPNARFVGQTGFGPRGDVIAEADWCVGEFLKTLEEENLLENTLIIFSSDNGPVIDDGYKDQSVELLKDHTPMGNFRGGKYSLYDAGTHIPFMVMYKGHIKPQISDALICQVDLYASLAKLVGEKALKNDSQNLLNVLFGNNQIGRKNLIIEGLQHRTAYRENNWVLIPPYKGKSKVQWGVDMETGYSLDYQLYNLENDKQQKYNLNTEKPVKLQQMIKSYNEALK